MTGPTTSAATDAFEQLYTESYDRLVRLARLTSADTVPAAEIVRGSRREPP